MISYPLLQEDITNGVKRSAHHCPVARASFRNFQRRTTVGLTRLSLTSANYNDKFTEYQLSKATIQLIRDFDDGKTIFPCIIEIEEIFKEVKCK